MLDVFVLTHWKIDDVIDIYEVSNSFLPCKLLVLAEPARTRSRGGGCRGGDGVVAVVAVPPLPAVLRVRVRGVGRAGVRGRCEEEDISIHTNFSIDI